jgi:hypothetical protein
MEVENLPNSPDASSSSHGAPLWLQEVRTLYELTSDIDSGGAKIR